MKSLPPLHPRRRFQRAMTIPELLMVITIIAILAVLGGQGYQHMINKAETVDAQMKLKGMYAGLSAYLLEKQSWPQEPEDDSESADPALWEWWKNEMEPYGIHEQEWFSSAHLRRLNREIKNAGGKAIDPSEIMDAVSFPSIFPANFDPGHDEPYRFMNQPWVMETGEYHGDDGVYAISQDGSIFKTMTMSHMNRARGTPPPGGGKK